MKLTTQKRLAAEILGAGTSRIWIDPQKADEVSKAITRDDVRHHISNGAIVVEDEKGNSRGRLRKKKEQKKKGRSRGHGKRKGGKTARTPKKEAWMRRVRALREELRKLRDEKKIDETNYRKFYRQIKGNLFHSRRHLREHIGVK